MDLNVVIDSGCFVPERAHATDAGMDLKTPCDFFLKPGGFFVVDTGVHIEIPKGYWGKLESKSGLNVKHGVVSLGGTIDSGYTGSIAVKLYNFSNRKYRFKRGDKLVQLIILPCDLTRLNIVDSLIETERGDNGFGSSGK